MKLLVVNQYYAPDVCASGQLLASLCEGLAERGFQIDVVCGFPSYTADAPDAPAYEEQPNLTVRRVATGGVKGRLGMRQRIRGYLGFLLAAFGTVRRQSRNQKYAVVLTLSNPPFVGLLGAWVKRFRGARYVCVLHDIHPDILIRTGRLKKGLVTGLWEIINRLIFRFADAVVVLGPRMAEHLRKHKRVPQEKIYVIPNWSLGEIEPLPRQNSFRETHKLGDALVVLYAGNMGILHNLEWLIESAAELKGRNIKFVFVGEGEKRFFLEKQAEQKRLDNVLFLPYQEAETLNTMLCAADICVVALEPKAAGLAVPSKTYSILAAGRAILALASENDDLAAVVRQWKCGWVAQNSAEVTEIIQAASKQPDEVVRRGKRARTAHKSTFSRESALALYADLIKSVVDSQRVNKEAL